MAQLEISNLSFLYPNEEEPALKDIDLAVDPGAFILLCGPTGCGKTTLLRQLKRELAPHGRLSGQLLYRGEPLADLDSKRLAGEIGMVMQDPDNQLVADEVLQELAFAMENMAIPPERMRRAIAEMVHFFGLEPLLHRHTDTLSGGQKQLVNLAAALVLQPRILLLDEPTAQLDPIAARDFLQIVQRINQELGITVIISEHRLEEIYPMADRVILMNEGRIAAEGPPRDMISRLEEGRDSLLLDYIPAISRLCLALKPQGQMPMTVKEGRTALQSYLHAIIHHRDSAGRDRSHAESPARSTGDQEREREQKQDGPGAELANNDFSNRPCLECRDVFFQYEKKTPAVLRSLNLMVSEGEYLAIIGGNGSGKTTLLQLLAGLHHPVRGDVLLEGRRKLKAVPPAERYARIGYLAQNPMLHFVHDTVEEELLHAAVRVGGGDPEQKVRELLSFFRLEPYRRRHPHDLSGGERQKTALAAVLLAEPRVLLVDEPTKGLDPVSRRELAVLLAELNRGGLTVVMVTHDVEFAARHAKRCAMLFDGEIAASGPPRELFGEHLFYTTTISRLMREYDPRMLVYEDVLQRWNAER